MFGRGTCKQHICLVYHFYYETYFSHKLDIFRKTQCEPSKQPIFIDKTVSLRNQMSKELAEVKTFDFSDTFVNTPVHFHFIDTGKVVHIWIGGDDASLVQVSYGLPIPSVCITRVP